MSRWRSAGLGLALAIATLFVYAQVRDHDYLNYDDDLYVVENPKLEQGLSWDGIVWALSTDADGLHVPVTWLSYLLDVELFRLEARGVLLANVAYHTLSGLMLFLAMCAATGAAGRSAFVAAVFLIHPIHAESVAWASERKDVLCGLFWNATLLAYVAYARRPSPLRYLGVALGVALALAAKPMAVTLPAVLLLLDFWPLSRLGGDASRIEWAALRRALLEKLPLAALSGASMWATYRAQAEDGVMRSLDAIPLLSRVGNASLSYVAYLGNSVWPTGLSVFYPPRTDPGIAALLAAALLLAITGLALRLRHRAAYLAVGWLWYLGTLVPVIGFVQVGIQAMANRYAYLPLVGIAIALAWGAHALVPAGRARAALGGVGLALAVAMASAARVEVSHWRDGVTLFQHALDANQADRTARGNLGIALLLRGDVDAGVREFATAFGAKAEGDEARRVVVGLLVRQAEVVMRERRPWFAIVVLRAALAISPDAPRLHDRIGRALFVQGRYDEAFTHLARAELGDEALADLHGRAAEELSRRRIPSLASDHWQKAIAAAARAAELERSRGREGRAREIEARRRDWLAESEASP